MDRLDIVRLLDDAELVDLAGKAKALTAAVKAEEDELLAELKRRHPEGAKLSGTVFDASVAICPGRESWDSQWLREHLHPNQLRHALKAGVSFLTVKVVAKRREAA